MTQFTFTFTTREEYLAYRTDWKNRYVAQSKKQIDLKKDVVEKQKVLSYKGLTDLMIAQSDLLAGKAAARKLLEERCASKLEAGKQYRAAKTAA